MECIIFAVKNGAYVPVGELEKKEREAVVKAMDKAAITGIEKVYGNEVVEIIAILKNIL